VNLRRTIRGLVGAGISLIWGCGPRPHVLGTDVCVFGGTSAGVIAAVQAAKMGRSAIVLEPGRHLGGMSAGGLGFTDIGNEAAIGGLARDFYRRVGRHYGKNEVWTFEPSVAERVFDAMLSEAGVPVRFGQRLASVKKTRARVVEIVTDSGEVYRAKVFIDATYEGDLMARAGVTGVVGRESNSTYGETLNGIRGRTPKNQFQVPIDPFVNPGDAASALLPFVQAGEIGNEGQGDRSVQAYNFRLCLTKNSANRKPMDAPAGYDARKYELLGRYFDALAAAGKAVSLDDFLSIRMVTADKADINNNGGFSTDDIGGSDAWPEADYTARERIYADQLAYVRGFLTYLATSPRVPSAIRTSMGAWGLCRDEFPETGGWPHQIYVREARRMISDYVMSERNCRRIEVVPDAVGLAAYNMDSHNCRRIVHEGKVENEGDVQAAVSSPFPIAYRSIVPRAAECENLVVPVAISASHVAYGSIRMEPVFMILGQSAATAAVIAIDDRVAVQRVDYRRLRAKLLADRQVLDWTMPGPAPKD
jgi:hypothetical protein